MSPATAARRRLTLELVRRGLAADADGARELVVRGRVLVSGAVATNPARQVGGAEPIRLVADPPRFVGRGGEKLAAALDRFGVAVDGRRALDAGASTGGFTDCLLQRGACGVVAVDVGYGQLHERLVADDRVTVVDRTNVRGLTPEAVGGAVDLLVADLSFISLRTVAAALVALVEAGGDLVVLVKPQFEAARDEADRGRGVIADPAVWGRVLHEVIAAFAGQGAAIMGAMTSPIHGADGNAEFLVHLAVPPSGTMPAPDEVDRLVAGAVVEAAAGRS